MKRRPSLAGISALTCLLVLTPRMCLAMMEIEIVTKDRAKELGLEVQAKAAGPDAVRVEVEFETKGALKDYKRVDLELSDGGKLLSSSTLREEPSKPGRIVVGFAAGRANLGKITLRVVVEHGPRDRIGYEIHVKDFVDLAAELKGAVKEVKGDLILVCISSNHGLKVGDTLEVYRTEPRPAYLGSLRLLAVKEAEAVGKLVTKDNEPVQVNDLVTRRQPTR